MFPHRDSLAALMVVEDAERLHPELVELIKENAVSEYESDYGTHDDGLEEGAKKVMDNVEGYRKEVDNLIKKMDETIKALGYDLGDKKLSELMDIRDDVQELGNYLGDA